MTMAIDPKDHAKWTALVQWDRGEFIEGREGLLRHDLRTLARDAVPALLDERKEHLALLREIQWNGLSDQCDVCHGHDPAAWDAWLPEVREDHIAGGHFRGHAQDCRIAASLKG
jgi:hypothetical protein